MAMLRMLGRDLHSNYGPTADTGGLMQNHAATIYAYPGLEALLEGEMRGGAKALCQVRAVSLFLSARIQSKVIIGTPPHSGMFAATKRQCEKCLLLHFMRFR
jgi:hypothetical protein